MTREEVTVSVMTDSYYISIALHYRFTGCPGLSDDMGVSVAVRRRTPQTVRPTDLKITG